MVGDVYSVDTKSCYRSVELEVSIVEITKGRGRENGGGSGRAISYRWPRKLVLKERTYEVVGERACFDVSGRDFCTNGPALKECACLKSLLSTRPRLTADMPEALLCPSKGNRGIAAE
jgi:hypothetical protein